MLWSVKKIWLFGFVWKMRKLCRFLVSASKTSERGNAPLILLPHLHLPIIPTAYFYISIRLFTYCGAELKALRKRLSLALWEFPSFITIITNYFHCFPTATIRGFNQSVTLYNQLMDHSGVTFGEKVCFCCFMPASCHWMPPAYLRVIRC